MTTSRIWTFIQKAWLPVLGMGLICLGLAYVHNWLSVTEARIDLRQDIRTYEEPAGLEAMQIAFKLAKPFLEETQQGYYQARLDHIQRPEVVIGWHLTYDSSSKVMTDLTFQELNRWAMMRTGGDQDAKWKMLMHETPYRDIEDLHNKHQDLELLSIRLTLDDSKPKSKKEVGERRIEFDEKRLAMEAVLDKHR